MLWVSLCAAALSTVCMLSRGCHAAADEVDRKIAVGLEAAIAGSDTHFPGVVLYASSPDLGSHAIAAGVAEIDQQSPLSPDAAFRAGSIAKPFVAAVVLQLVEEDALSLEATLPDLLPSEIHARIRNADGITLRMLLNHTSGIPDWLTDSTIARIAAEPSKIWTAEEFIDIATAEATTFAPGTGWAYSNTDYNLLGLIIERVSGVSWREAVRERVIAPLALAHTTLPEPGDTSMPGAFMHGYGMIDGHVLDLSFVDPSMAGAAGGDALVTTVGDLALFLTALRTGRLFKNPTTFATMSEFVPAESEGGQVGYGLGLEQYVLSGGLEMIGHAGGTAGYRSGAFFFPGLDLTMTFAMSVSENPMPVIRAGLAAMAPGSLK